MALSLLDRERTIAPAGFSRWLVPPAALAIHLSIGQVYAFSVFNNPLEHVIGISKQVQDDWKATDITWIFTLAIVFLGLSAAIFGKWLERVGPRKAMFAAACCFGGGFLVSALGVQLHQLVLIYLGYGVLGGIGLGLGYISPVSTLIKWFPDRPGMATGLAIMGFGGGAMIGGPLGVFLMNYFHTQNPASTGIAQTWVVMGIGYFLFMLFGAVIVRLPPPGWKPAGYVPPTKYAKLITSAQVTADSAIQTPQFYLVWLVLFLNVTAGIAILKQASPMIQDMFSDVTPLEAGGFVGLLSIFNMAGRFIWSSISDFIGRKATYAIFFLLGACLYALVPGTGHMGSKLLFIACCAVILSMYGGGFATVPAYLKDLFGTMQVGAIHGRLLTAWSAAGVAGPFLITYIQKYMLDHDVSKSRSYDYTMYIMAGLLVIGAVCNFLVRPVNPRYHFEQQVAELHSDPAVKPA